MTKLARLVGMALCALSLVGCSKAKMDFDSAIETRKALATKFQDVQGMGTAQNDGGLIGVDQIVAGNGEDKIQLMGKSCNRSKSGGNGTNSAESQTTLNGSECPIELQVKENKSDRHPRYSLHYSAKTDEAKKARDLESLDANSETNQSDDSLKKDHQESVEAVIVSKGKLSYHETIRREETPHGLTGEMVMTVETPDKAAEAKITRSLDGDNNIKEDILFNGEKPSEEVSQKLHDLTINMWALEQH